MPIDPAFAAPGRFFKGNIHTHSSVIERLLPGGWGRVVVVDAQGGKAWTNPVFFAD
jgi:hypothetical protein